MAINKCRYLGKDGKCIIADVTAVTASSHGRCGVLQGDHPEERCHRYIEQEVPPGMVACSNCFEVVDDYYYHIGGITPKTCSLSCMAEFLCKNKMGHIKTHMDAAKKKIIKFRAI